MSVYNLDIIKKLLVFDSEDDFYHLQIIKRKKEHPELGSNSAIIKTYYIKSIEYLDNKYAEIVSLCNLHDARACINLNRRSFERISYHMLRKVTEQIMNKDFQSVRKAYESVCGAHSNEPNKSWIIDIDDKGFSSASLLEFLQNLRPEGNKLKAYIETKNGYHIITSPFDIQEFKNKFPQIDIHKDNPTILYIP